MLWKLKVAGQVDIKVLECVNVWILHQLIDGVGVGVSRWVKDGVPEGPGVNARPSQEQQFTEQMSDRIVCLPLTDKTRHLIIFLHVLLSEYVQPISIFLETIDLKV